MEISRNLAIQILKYLHSHKDFYFPFLVVNKEYSEEDGDFVEICPDEFENIEADEKYQTFELWGNLQNLHEETLELMAKGFLEKIASSGNTAKTFVFFSAEGHTFQPGSESEIPDVENFQILGIEKGKTAEGAFENFMEENRWLEKTNFNKALAYELKNEKIYHFEIKL